MANQTVKPDLVAKAIQAAIEPKLMFTNSLSREFEKEFEGSVAGQTRRVKFLPHIPVVHNNLTYAPVSYIEKSKDIELNQTTSTYLKFDALESITEFGLDGVIKAQANTLNSYVNELERKLTNDMVPLAGNAITVAASSFNLATLRSANSSLLTVTNGGGGKQVHGLFSIENLATVKNDTQSLAAISKVQEDAFNRGNFEMYDGIKIGTCEYVPNHLTGTRNSVGTVSADYIEGNDYIVLAGLGAGAVILKGELFTVAGIRRYSMKTGKTLGNYQFVALETATANGSGVANVKIEPIYATNAGNHVGWKNVNALPTATAVTTFVGAAGQEYAQGIIYMDTFACQYWAQPKAVKNPALGVSSVSSDLRMPVSFWEDSNFNTYSLGHRLDSFYGSAVLRPEEAVRIILT